MNIFELMHDRYRLPHHVRLFEAFAGIGCQRMALNRLQIPCESVGVSEIDKYALLSYKAIHRDCNNYGDITKMDSIPPCDIFTWSFPCTDLSKAGKRQGMNEGTRSGLVYEVLRLLHATENKPQVLIMENVVDLVQTKFIRQFQAIQTEIERMGYTNYVQTLNAKDYGVAQNRDRVFMVSILGEWYYEFPKPQRLEKRLKDYLEEKVDEKYYLTDKMLNFFQENSKKNEEKGNGFRFKPQKGDNPALAITTRAGGRMDDNFVSESIAIPEDTAKGYALAQDGDGVYINRPEQKRGVVQKGMIQTLKANGNDVVVTSEIRIRKLTPLECWRLMGIDDSDFYKAQTVISNSQLYKTAGNGICVDVFAAILKTMIGSENDERKLRSQNDRWTQPLGSSLGDGTAPR
jgi:DNA (cytosine-5)-methyltransferase 1